MGVELDGTDITAMLSLDGEDFIYTPVEPLSSGEHTIRLVVLGDNSQEKGSWRFQIDGNVTSENISQAATPTAAQIAEAEQWLRGGAVNIDTLTEVSKS